MDIFALMKESHCKEVLFFDEPAFGLQAIVAIDNTMLGPALGVCKLYDYTTAEQALRDALDMASYNTISAALLHRSMGGGSIVLMGDRSKVKSEMYFRALGIFINKLYGKIFMTNDSGINTDDMLNVRRESEYVLGLDKSVGGSGSTLVSSAKGLLWGIQAAAKDVFDTTSLKGMKILVQGVGDVGSALVEQLITQGADLTITDLVYDKIKVIQDRQSDIKVIKPNDTYTHKCDVLCICSANDVINAERAEQINCKILTGFVPRITDSPETEDILLRRGILYIPGFIINSGRFIQLSNELQRYPTEKTDNELKDIYYTTQQLIQQSRTTKQHISAIAISNARKYLEQVAAVKSLK